jgi:hypothetical protein
VSWKTLVVIMALSCVGCGEPFRAGTPDAAMVDALSAPVDAMPVDTSPPACGPSPITIDVDCCAGCTDSLPCQRASGLAKAPCAFQGGWLVADCSQCRWLP